MECTTIDQMLARLEKLKEKHGGDCRVRLRTYGRELMMANVYETATGKSDPWRVVSRGGVPCVVIGE